MASKDKVFYLKNTLNISGNLTDLSTPKIMGILNVTDDSFYDGGKYFREKDIVRQAEKLIAEGADFIDIGGYSSRPGAKHIDEDSEARRVLKGIKIIRKISTRIPISVDTFRAGVAARALDAGADMVNDISGGELDDKMFETVARYNVPYILMHMRGSPQNMMEFITYEHLVAEILDYFNKKLLKLTQIGLKDVIIDVGFGFSKTVDQNYELLKNLEYFSCLNHPLLVGISRKSMIYKILKTTPEEALNGTTAVNTVALLKRAKFLRVHDVLEAREIVEIIKLINN